MKAVVVLILGIIAFVVFPPFGWIVVVLGIMAAVGGVLNVIGSTTESLSSAFEPKRNSRAGSMGQKSKYVIALGAGMVFAGIISLMTLKGDWNKSILPEDEFAS